MTQAHARSTIIDRELFKCRQVFLAQLGPAIPYSSVPLAGGSQAGALPVVQLRNSGARRCGRGRPSRHTGAIYIAPVRAPQLVWIQIPAGVRGRQVTKTITIGGRESAGVTQRPLVEINLNHPGGSGRAYLNWSPRWLLFDLAECACGAALRGRPIYIGGRPRASHLCAGLFTLAGRLTWPPLHQHPGRPESIGWIKL